LPIEARRPPAVWRNWSRTQSCAPASIEHPADRDAVIAAVGRAVQARRALRVAGAGHSFTDAACSTGTLLVMDRMRQVLEIDRDALSVRVQPGCTLGELSGALAEHGLALGNLGDIDRQTVAGATATATHGTGVRLPTMSEQVVALELITGDGSARTISPEHDLEEFRAAQVAIGALGVVTSLTLRCVPAFRLRVVEEPMPVDAVLGSLQELSEAHEHFEFFSFPYTGMALTRRADRTDRPRTSRGRPRAWVEEVLVGNHLFELLLAGGRAAPRLVPALNRVVVKALDREVRVQDSHAALASRRLIRFVEMEWAIPRAAAADAVRGVRELIRDDRMPVNMPIEVRFAAPDEAFLSPTHGRESCYVAVHAYRGMSWQPYFRSVERLMSELGGRPHWGKLHFQTFETLRARYPAWSRFQRVRARLDPEGRFRNAYTDRVLGVPGDVHA
jgi:L-gulono-1,4-lactone dehydrogenase